MDATEEPLFTPEQLAAEIAPRGRGHNGRRPWDRPAHWTPTYVVHWQGIMVALDGQMDITNACVGEVDEFEACHGQPVSDDRAQDIAYWEPASLQDAITKQTAPDDRQGD